MTLIVKIVHIHYARSKIKDARVLRQVFCKNYNRVSRLGAKSFGIFGKIP